jgi:hypothetical protein
MLAGRGTEISNQADNKDNEKLVAKFLTINRNYANKSEREF